MGVTVALGDTTPLRIGSVGNGREEAGLVGASDAMGKSIVSEDEIRSGMRASYAKLSHSLISNSIGQARNSSDLSSSAEP